MNIIKTTNNFRVSTLFIPVLLLAWSVTAAAEVKQGNMMISTEIKSNSTIGNIPGIGNIPLGGLSALAFDRSASTPDHWIFWSITDRGINSVPGDFRHDGIMDRMLPLPNFSPMLVKVSYDLRTKSAQVTGVVPLRNQKGESATGRGNVDPRQSESQADEGMVDLAHKPLTTDPQGVDTESLAIDSQGFFWVGEEYGPSILKVAPDGRILSRFIPKESHKARLGVRNLPKEFGQRTLNRGFEGMTLVGNILYAFLQSPITAKDGASLVRVLAFDIEKEQTVGVYFYPLYYADGKIGDATTTADGHIVVIEQMIDPINQIVRQDLFQVDFSQATNLLEAPAGDIQNGAIKKVFNLADTVTKNFEKLEGLAALPTGGFAILNDNDFNVARITAKLGKAALPPRVENRLFILPPPDSRR